MILLSNAMLESIKGQAREEMPNEACGYLAGNILADGTLVAAERIPMTNVDASPDHFSFDPKEQLLDMTKQEWESLEKPAFNSLFKSSAVKRAGFVGLKRNVEFLSRKK